MKAFICRETYLQSSGLVFATSAGKARMIAARSAWDAGYPAKITTIKVRREPSLDRRMPADYRNQCYGLDYIKYLPLPSVEKEPAHA